MALQLNRCAFAGNLTKKVTVKTVGDRKVANFTLAINRAWRGADGEKKNAVDYIDCEFWGDKRVDALAQYTDKGSNLYVEARATQQTWNDKETGKRQSRIVFTVEDFSFNDMAKKDTE